MAVTAAAVKELREKTGVGMMDCKKALVETDGNFDKAIDFLREKGLASAKKKSGRATGEGLVASYIHQGGKVGVLVDISCETDFVAKTDDFITLINDVAMHIAAASPAYIDRESVPSEIIEKEKEIFTAQMKEEGKPEQVIDKIVTGKIDKFYKENCLLEQEFVKDPDKTINDLVSTAIAKLGENIKIKQFARFKVGEGDGSSSDEGSEGDNE